MPHPLHCRPKTHHPNLYAYFLQKFFSLNVITCEAESIALSWHGRWNHTLGAITSMTWTLVAPSLYLCISQFIIKLQRWDIVDKQLFSCEPNCWSDATASKPTSYCRGNCNTWKISIGPFNKWNFWASRPMISKWCKQLFKSRQREAQCNTKKTCITCAYKLDFTSFWPAV